MLAKRPPLALFQAQIFGGVYGSVMRSGSSGTDAAFTI
jgi:hypothetical protein